MTDIRKEQYKDLLERHIPPLLKDLEGNAKYYQTKLPPQHEITRFYEKLLDTVQKLKLRIEKCLDNETLNNPTTPFFSTPRVNVLSVKLI